MQSQQLEPNNECVIQLVQKDITEKTFNIKVTMNSRWINDFCSFLKYMEHNGNIGHSSYVAFFADGDGDFRPKFEIDTEFKEVGGYTKEDCPLGHLEEPEIVFDAD